MNKRRNLIKKIKYSVNDLKRICTSKGLMFIEVRNEIVYEKSRRCVVFSCKIHNDNVQVLPVEKIIHNKKPCRYCNGHFLKLTFKDKIKQINPNIELLSDYKGYDNKIKCRCKIDGYEWETRAGSLLNGFGCKICGYKRVWEIRGRKNTQTFVEEMKVVDRNIKIIGEYTGSKELIECECLIDKRRWKSYPSNLLNKSAGCPECAKRKFRSTIAKPISQNEFIKKVNMINSEIKVLGKYINNTTKVKMKCMKHNLVFDCHPRSVLYKEICGCSQCNTISMGEKILARTLKNLNINFVLQHSFADCKHINRLRFDAYDINNNIAFEYQGEQHYYPVNFSGKGDEVAQEEYKKGRIRDEIKYEYCKNNGISLIAIPYWERDNMEVYIRNELININNNTLSCD